MYVKAPKPKLDTSGSLPIRIPPPIGNQPEFNGNNTGTSNLVPHRHSSLHRMVHNSPENVLDYYRTIQLPLVRPSGPTRSASNQASCSLLKSLTHPSELGKRRLLTLYIFYPLVFALLLLFFHLCLKVLACQELIPTRETC